MVEMMFSQLPLSMMRLHTLFFTEHLEQKIWCLCVMWEFFWLDNNCWIAQVAASPSSLTKSVFRLDLNQHFIFVLVIRHVDGPPLWALIGPVSGFVTPVTLANPGLWHMHSLALCSEGIYRCRICWKGINCIMSWRSFDPCGTLLSLCAAGCPFWGVLEG